MVSAHTTNPIFSKVSLFRLALKSTPETPFESLSRTHSTMGRPRKGTKALFFPPIRVARPPA